MKSLNILLLLLPLLTTFLSGAAAQSPEPEERVAVSGMDRRVAATPAKSKKNTQNLLTRAAGASSLSFLGSVNTSSPAESFAINGNLAYVCDDNEVTIVDISNPLNPQVVGTALSTFIRSSGAIQCAIQRNSLVVFADQASSTIGNNPGIVTFSLTNPLQPQLISATSINKRFFQRPVYIGNMAYVPIAALTFFLGFQWDGQYGDLVAIDLNNLASPTISGTLAQPQISATFGGPTPVLGAVQADASLIYLGGATSTQNQNSGIGRLQVADVSNPGAMKTIGQLLIPGTVHFNAPLLQATVAVGIGNTGGYVGQNGANPGEKGNIVVATFDVSDRRTPLLLSTKLTNYSVGSGGGATRIGNNLFAFAGVIDSNNNPVLLTVDITNPKSPLIDAYPIAAPFTSMQAIGSTLYASLGAGGFATFSIPGGTAPGLSCPLSLDTMLLFDRGANATPQAFASAKTALKAFVDSLHLAPDQAGLISFAATTTLSQTLTTSSVPLKLALDGIVPGGNSNIGAAIAAAQSELTGPRRNPSASPLLIVVSDGGDRGAANSSATLSAAANAKAAGIRIVTLQYGSAPGNLMQAIASSNTDYYLVPLP